MWEAVGRRRRRGVARITVGASATLAAGAVLAACSSAPLSGSHVAAPADDRPLVLTTFTVLADIARNVAGDRVLVESITKVGAEIHGYEPTPGDLRRAAGADLILDNGLGLEAWFERFVADLDAPHAVVSEGIVPIAIPDDGVSIASAALSPSPADGGVPVASGSVSPPLPAAGDPSTAATASVPDPDVAINPHAWMSPAGGARYARNIAAALAELDPPGAATYRANAEGYAATLEALHTELVDAVAAIPPAQRVLVTCEGAFSYLARDAGLEEAYIWPVNAERQATPRRVARVIDLVRERGVPAVFCESTVSAQPMERVAESTHATLAGTLYVDSLSDPEGAVPTYIDLLRHDIALIVSGLAQGAQS